MREIKFRGQKEHSKEWVYGNLIQFDWADFIVKYSSFEERWRVIPESVGQYTGLKDKNGVDIYSDDVLFDGETLNYRVYSVAGGFAMKADYWADDLHDLIESDMLILEALADPQFKNWIQQNCEVIGNIHQNPEQLNKEEEK